MTQPTSTSHGYSIHRWSKLVRALPLREVHTVVSMQWGGIKNGTLLRLIEEESFHMFLTGDKNMQSQQRLEGRPFAVLILSAINWPVIEPHPRKTTYRHRRGQTRYGKHGRLRCVRSTEKAHQ